MSPSASIADRRTAISRICLPTITASQFRVSLYPIYKKMEERGIFKDNEVTQSLNVDQNSVPLIGAVEELPMPTPASAAAATPDSTEGQKREMTEQYDLGSEAMLSGDGTTSPGSNFKTYVLTVNSGEDVFMKIMSLSQQEYHTISILSATGAISNVTLRQSDASGGTSTYEGIFEILSLNGTFVPTENGLTKSRAGSISVSLAGPNGGVFGGALAGLLVAAGSVQVVVASCQPEQQKPKKQRTDYTSPTASSTSSHINNHVSAEQLKPIMSSASLNFASFGNGQCSSNSSSSSSVDDEHV